ncbi:MAG: hydrogenase maturation nickel metallochaperone HypA [candidate division Zixibacteria bacterium]|nr:hydrogenase maturation nickel metallochaperone HypA [Candidatus Tariuqbacter arcticus]
MHELYIAESILASTRESLPAEFLPESVRQIWVQVGRLDAVVPETLIFMFDAIKSSHGMPGAELSLESIEVLCRCGECGNEFEIDLPMFICPECGGGQVEVLRGRGIKLTRINAEEPEG